MLDKVQFKQNKVAIFSLLVAGCLTILAYIGLTNALAQNPPTAAFLENNENIDSFLSISGFWSLYVLLAVTSAVVGIIFIYNAHNNARLIAQKYDILPWPAWATCLFAFIPVVNLGLFNFSLYKILTASKAAKIFIVAFFIQLLFSVLQFFTSVYSSFINTQLRNPDGVDASVVDTFKSILWVDTGFATIEGIFILIAFYGLYKTQKEFRSKENK